MSRPAQDEAAKPTILRRAINPDLHPLDAAAAAKWRGELAAAGQEAEVAKAIAAILAEEPLAGFLAAVMDLSPFLRRLILDDPRRLLRVLDDAPDTRLAVIRTTTEECWKQPEEEAMATLRQSRAELALLVALADLGMVWDIGQSMAALSSFAEAAIGAAASMALVKEHVAGHIRLPNPSAPQKGCGWIVLAMGKLGGNELNYSSDVDLIALFDPEAAAIPPDTEPAKLFIRLTQSLIRILQEHTADGMVLRTDLRLRPDPGSTAVAISVPAALLYYEVHGQNWERAALIKARPVAGDIAAGEAFLKELSPFIWRKYLDYAAIADIHSIKRQIHDHRGHASIAVAGHNIKLGRGGIREIEFFVQTQQLIAGGRNPALRGRGTLAMLTALAEIGWIDQTAAEELTASYRLFRIVEHRLQMIGDEQTHTLPDDDEGLLRVARLARTGSVAAFEALLRPGLEATRRHYAQLFEEAPALSANVGNLVFTGDEDDPETLATLAALGFADPGQVSTIVRGWHFGRCPATRSAAARERLTEVTPALLDALARDRGDAAVLAFDRFLARLPAGVQLFALLGSNPWLLSLLADILGSAPRMADIVTRRPHVLDAILEPAFLEGLPDHATLAEHLRLTMDEAKSYEDALDRMRIFGQEQCFLIGIRILAGAIDMGRAGAAFSDLADLLIAEALRLADAAMVEAQNGHMPSGRVAIVAMGKLGGREMTAASDLDLIVLYQFAEGAIGSDGAHPLAGAQYYARLTQRLVAALSAPTAEGGLYEVDFRLRPSGNSGPLATNIDSFIAYQTSEAWTWEHLALTRARLVAGDERLIRAATAAMRSILAKPRPAKGLTEDVTEMRRLIETEKGADDPWDIKTARGGLIDVEFIAQYLQLRHAGEQPGLLNPSTDAALSAAAEAKLLSRAQADILLPAFRLYQTLIQIIRLCLDEPFHSDTAPEGLKALLARATALPDFARLQAHLVETQGAVRAVFAKIVGKLPTG